MASIDTLAEDLYQLLDPILYSTEDTELAAGKMLLLNDSDQNFILHWVKVTAATNNEMAIRFAEYACDAFEQMNQSAVEQWLIEAMDTFDKNGLYPAMQVLRNHKDFYQQWQQRNNGLDFYEISTILDNFVAGLNGRKLKLSTAAKHYTDSETLYLPEVVSLFAERQDNFNYYKILACMLWAQNWYGSWQIDIEQAFSNHANPEKAWQYYHYFESIRLQARLQKDFPGIYRQIQQLKQQLAEKSCIEKKPPCSVEPLLQADAGWQSSVQLVEALKADFEPVCLPFYGCMQPQQVQQCKTQRIAKEKQQFQRELQRLKSEVASKLNAQQAQQLLQKNTKLHQDETLVDENITLQLEMGDTIITPPDVLQTLGQSIIQDLGEIPEEYLVAAGEGFYDDQYENKEPLQNVWQGVHKKEGSFLYPEWDYLRKHYKKDWCLLREIDIPPVDNHFVANTLQKYRAAAHALKRSFEALRGEEKLLKKQAIGDDIDIDAVVESWADMNAGMELGDRLFQKMSRNERNIAVMIMVDMSGSTKGWINDAIRESLVLLCEALEKLGDQYAIYGFSGFTRNRCEIFRVKPFDVPYNEQTQARISGIEPKDYTRMGVAIRHLSKILNQQAARTRLLITLSDGKPDDFDGYRGKTGIEDTRKALIEAKTEGIFPFCITIDEQAKDYLPHMYGPVNFVVLDEVKKLPTKVAEIYRKLTT